MANPYVFIVGCPRSGTTLLQRIVNAHPQMAIISESRWIAEWFEERRGLTQDGFVTPQLISLLLEHPRFSRLHIKQEALTALMEGRQPMPYSCFVSGIFDIYGKAQGRTFVGNKTPAHVTKLHTLHALWPTARFIHIIRDGRDVCLSILEWPKAHQIGKPGSFSTWNDDALTTTALWWEANVRCGRDAGSLFGSGLYYEIRYELLVTRPAEECAAMCNFLGLHYDKAMLRFHEGRSRDELGLSAKRAWQPLTAGLRDWRRRMSVEEIERFEAAAGQLLAELGYSRVVPDLRPERRQAAIYTQQCLSSDPNWTGYFKRPVYE